MGMDVYGKQPTSKTGEYFRANVWWWRPIAEISLHFAPEVCAACKHWGSNDGDGLDAAGAQELATALEQTIEAGQLQAYIAKRERMIAALPDETCGICKGTGVRSDAIGVENGWPKVVITADEVGPRYKDNPASHPRFGQTGSCNSCLGAGSLENWQRHYPADLDVIKEWIAFLKDCGGFEIC